MGFHFYLLISLLPLLGLTDAGQEAIRLVSLHEPNPSGLHFSSHTTSSLPLGASTIEADLPIVSSSVLAAESWLKTRLIAQLPYARITTIVVGRGVLCTRGHEQQWGLVLPSVKNLYYSLVRWGLAEEIKVSAAFSSDCLHQPPLSDRFRSGIAENKLRPLLEFLLDSDSVYSIDPPYHLSLVPDGIQRVFGAHRVALERLGFSHLRDIRVVSEAKPMSRKLSSIMSIPSFSGELKPHVSQKPIAPAIQFAPVPDSSFSFVPNTSPSEVPSNPPDLSAYPSLSPNAPPPTASPSVVPAKPPTMPTLSPPSPSTPTLSPPSPFIPTFSPPLPSVPTFAPQSLPSPPSPCSGVVPAPKPGAGEGQEKSFWCVAKPTVPAEKLQEAMDYACGHGGANCEEIKPDGSCYYPDTVVAHASYAFNSYWQKMKHSGGSCSFDGTAVLITSDPSFNQCRFLLD